MQSSGLLRKEEVIAYVQSGQPKYDGTKNVRSQGELEDKKDKILSILNLAVSLLYDEVKQRVVDTFSDSTGGRHQYNMLHNDFGSTFCEFEEQVERCNLVAEFVNDVRHCIGKDIPSVGINMDHPKYYSESNWVYIFKTSFLSCKDLVRQMTEVVLPDLIRSAVSLNSEVMDAFGLISQIRGSIDTALEHLVEVEMERASLIELDQNYFFKVGLITEQQLALEEAALKGRDHLSWEEAEELASQEEACRAQLDQLHQTWNQRDVRTSSLLKREADIKNALVSMELHFQSLLGVKEEKELRVLGSKALLAALVKPFFDLESIDNMLSSSGGSFAVPSSKNPSLRNLINSGFPVSEYVWKVGGLLNSHSFFIWKIVVLDSFLDSCIHDVASSVDQNLGFDQLLSVMKKKLEIQLQKHIVQYLKERVAPSLLVWLDKEE
ncbi:Serine/threonine-protein kinase [Quillaja saponaria]|uniref:Serine/threonine-protein kinase n=1 Tax=Quillaja saponaria TaxID=32244 RepID=A0AAD7LZU7_QUISA|nr:Serine/threonine-protein kinase [Quillaja saponaria]